MASWLPTVLGYLLISDFTTVVSLLWLTGLMLLTVPQVVRTLLKLNIVTNECLYRVSLNALTWKPPMPPIGHLLAPDTMKQSVTRFSMLRVAPLPCAVPHRLVGPAPVAGLLCSLLQTVTTWLCIASMCLGTGRLLC